MQDGSVSSAYRETHVECGYYSMALFSAETEIGYVNPNTIKNLIQATYAKMAPAIREYQSGERDHFRFYHKCCVIAWTNRGERGDRCRNQGQRIKRGIAACLDRLQARLL